MEEKKTKNLNNALGLLYLVNKAGGILSRIKLQKLVCLIEFGYKNSPLSFTFKSHFYGPYSEELRECADRLISLGLLDEKTISNGQIEDGTNFTYFYSTTEAGKKVISKNIDKIKNYSPIDSVLLEYKNKPNQVIIQAAKEVSGMKSTK